MSGPPSRSRIISTWTIDAGFDRLTGTGFGKRNSRPGVPVMGEFSWRGVFLSPARWVSLSQPYRAGCCPPPGGRNHDTRRNLMSVSKRALLAAGASLVIGLSTVAVAQTTAGNKKSSEVTTIGEGEAVMIGPKGQRLHKSKVKVNAAKHEAAMKKGATEVRARHCHLQTRWQTLHAAGQCQREGVGPFPRSVRR